MTSEDIKLTPEPVEEDYEFTESTEEYNTTDSSSDGVDITDEELFAIENNTPEECKTDWFDDGSNEEEEQAAQEDRRVSVLPTSLKAAWLIAGIVIVVLVFLLMFLLFMQGPSGLMIGRVVPGTYPAIWPLN